MRVLQLGPFAPPHGGVQSNLAAIRDALVDRGISCPVVTLTRAQSPSVDACEIYRPQNAIQFISYLVRLRYDIVHLHIGGSVTLRLLGVTFLCTLIPRCKFVLTFHSGGYASSKVGRTARPWTLRGIVFRRVDRVICVNREIIDLFERFGVAPARTRLIPPYALKVPSGETEIPYDFKRFLETHSPLLVSVGLLEREYNLPMQIEVLGLIRETFAHAGLIMIGSGSQEQDLRRRIEKQSYAEHIMLCGDIEHQVTIHVIAESDLMLRTTAFDGDAISVREALHLGTPVIATDNGMRPEGVHLIPFAHLDELRQAIVERLTEPEQTISQLNDSNEHVLAVLDLYQELLAEK